MGRASYSVDEGCISVLSAVVRSEIVGKPLSFAQRSAATAIVLKFGTTRRLTDQSGGDREVGYWDLIVEFGRWQIAFGDRTISDESELHEIDDALDHLVGGEVEEFLLTPEGDLSLALANRVRLSVVPSGRHGQLSEWVLFRDMYWSLALEACKGFVLEA